MRRISSHSFANGNCVEVEDAPFRKSSFSVSGHCAEAGSFRKSSFSGIDGQCAEAGFCKFSASNGNDGCTEAGQDGTVILVRDTKQEHLGEARTVLAFSPGAWTAFTQRLKEDAI